jgi:hypothetical protein
VKGGEHGPGLFFTLSVLRHFDNAKIPQPRIIFLLSSEKKRNKKGEKEGTKKKRKGKIVRE